jgi:glutathione synthase/RimK-type ligase-like ATP-grasp enzyme
MPVIAIHPDSFVHANGRRQSFSTRWSELAAASGVRVKQVNVHTNDFFRQLAGCDGFMWRFDFAAPERLLAKRILLAVEQTGTMVFPSWPTAWHFEDKIGQHYLLRAAGLPTPATWVFWDAVAARDFVERAALPLVIKLTHGYRSANVRLIRTREEVRYWIDRLFAGGIVSLDEGPASRTRTVARRARAALRTLRGRSSSVGAAGEEWQHGYVYLQEFLPDNPFDTRVTVIGNRAFAYRRFNRPGDFRASGSGRFDWDVTAIDADAVRLAVAAARALGTQCIAVDVLFRNGRPVINEISYTFASWVVHDCPGHWMVSGAPPTAPLTWVPGSLPPEDAIFQDFMTVLETRWSTQHAAAL